MYELNMYLFDNSKPEELLFFVKNYEMMLEASGMLTTGDNIQYLRTFPHV